MTRISRQDVLCFKKKPKQCTKLKDDSNQHYHDLNL